MKIDLWKVTSLVLAGALAFTLATSSTPRAEADQPKMESALTHLKSAVNDLNAAQADKGGHRAKALQFAKDALAETERGIEYARTHP